MKRIDEVAGTIRDEQFVSRYLTPSRPVVFRGLVKDWPAVTQWSAAELARLVSRMGDIDVAFLSTPPGMKQVDVRQVRQGTMSLTALLQACADEPNGPELYVPGGDIPRGNPMERFIGTPEFLATQNVVGKSIFFGRNTRSIGHFHANIQALICQVQGEKRIAMYPPSTLSRLHLFPIWTKEFVRTRVNFDGFQSEFPTVQGLPHETVTLSPGDALFIPLHWFHVAHGTSWNVSITHWWPPKLREWPIGRSSLRSLAGMGAEALFARAEQVRAKLRWNREKDDGEPC